VPETAFILGSPRSGTTLLGDILDLHPQIGRWYEPYFVMDRYFSNAPSDNREAEDATDEVKQQVTRAFSAYRRRARCNTVVDKTPRNCFKIPFLLQVFPRAKFIHVLRDGRDVTLSIYREWKRRQDIIEGRASTLQAVRVLKGFLDRQTFLDHKLAALAFEIGSVSNLFKGRLHMTYRFRRWNGRTGWGPQFEGWQDVIDEVSTLEFSAMQWRESVAAVLRETPKLDRDQMIETRYEDLLDQPKETLEQLFSFLELPFPIDFMTQLPKLKASNYGKWRDALSDEEKALIGPILDPLLTKLDYASGAWYPCQE
jgi:hypothetical protein